MFAFLSLSFAAPPTGSLADPAGSSAIVAAISWIQQTMLGTAATAVAVVAVSFVGLSMLNGRVSVRRGVTVIAGCFILFGAPVIAAGIQSFVGDGDAVNGSWSPEPAPPTVPVLPSAPARPVPASGGVDPYAGASVPGR